MLLGWAWRVPFLSSIVLILIALFIRLRLKESPTFVELEKHEQIAEHPLREIFGHSLRQRAARHRAADGRERRLVHVQLAGRGATPPAPIMVNKSIGPIAVAVASLIGMVSVPLAGHISDRVGRVPVYRFGARGLLRAGLPGLVPDLARATLCW